jgi:hypothetical protein
VPNLPLNGATGIDPAVILVGYIGLIFWLAATFQEPIQKALRSASLLGLMAGLLLVAEIAFKSQTENAAQAGLVTKVLLAAVAILWGISGLRGAQNTGNGGIGPLAGMWSAMVSGLIAAAAILGQALFSGPLPASQDPWRQYEGLAVGLYPQLNNFLSSGWPSGRRGHRPLLFSLRQRKAELKNLSPARSHESSVSHSFRVFAE